MRYNFHKKVVVITGVVGGIGSALALKFAEAGARLVLIDLEPMLLSALANQLEKINTDTLMIPCDVTDRDRVFSAIQQAIAHYGGIDVLINNAGITHYSQFSETDLTVFKRVMDVNFYGALFCTKAALDSLLERKGLIITLSSLSGFAPLLNRSAYSASKHALHGLFDSLRIELQSNDVRVMMVCPGRTATDFHKNALVGDGSAVPEPLSLTGKIASPNDVAVAIFNGAAKGDRLLILSNVTKRAWLLFKFFPKLYERFYHA